MEELELEKAPMHKEFFIAVSYYEGNIPFVFVTDDIAKHIVKYDEVYKIKVPYRVNNISK